MTGELPADFGRDAADAAAAAHAKAETVASRKASQHRARSRSRRSCPNCSAARADLTGSNLTNTSARRRCASPATARCATDGQLGRHINYGVREFGMAAIMNGVALHGGFIPYGGTFLTFSDYSRNAIRMAALMKRRVIHVFTHDSIGLGEDGPTHQSVEHAASLRLIPGPRRLAARATRSRRVAWALAIERSDRPSALLLSRQNLPYAPKPASIRRRRRR